MKRMAGGDASNYETSYARGLGLEGSRAEMMPIGLTYEKQGEMA